MSDKKPATFKFCGDPRPSDVRVVLLDCGGGDVLYEQSKSKKKHHGREGLCKVD